jgi:hypothetical protein
VPVTHLLSRISRPQDCPFLKDVRLLSLRNTLAALEGFLEATSELSAIQSQVPLIIGGRSTGVRQIATELGIGWNCSCAISEASTFKVLAYRAVSVFVPRRDSIDRRVDRDATGTHAMST